MLSIDLNMFQLLLDLKLYFLLKHSASPEGSPKGAPLIQAAGASPGSLSFIHAFHQGLPECPGLPVLLVQHQAAGVSSVRLPGCPASGCRDALGPAAATVLKQI